MPTDIKNGKFGLKQCTINKINGVFSTHPRIERVIIYGSRAKGNYRNSSDIDLTIEGAAVSLSTLLKVETELDDLLLPYTIDLSLLHLIDDQDLLNHIRRVGLVFYERKAISTDSEDNFTRSS